MKSSALYIGLMSGTSADGIDVALVDFSTGKMSLSASYYQAYDDVTHQKITELYQPAENEIDRTFALDVTLAHLFSKAISALLSQEKLTAKDIVAIGNHGQTIRHRPLITTDISAPFTLQIGCSQTLAILTGIRVIGDFRKKDVALGGQGAPLVPAFHRYLLPQSDKNTFLVNIGGIANLTYLPTEPSASIAGFDTGPGNALLDAWCYLHTNKRYDNNGDWGRSGRVIQTLLTQLLADPYFDLTAPKSTGREYFTIAWLSTFSDALSLSAEDVQATLTALTAHSIANDINALAHHGNVYICGGGIDNAYCYELLKQALPRFNVEPIVHLNINNEAFEAMAFAWLAFAYDNDIVGNIPAVTGAKKSAVLGNAFTA
jgi:anhydro-N-acetylmuramic acid kinase